MKFLLAFALFFGLFVVLLERSFIYYPIRELAGTPRDIGLAYEEAAFAASDGTRLHGWFVPGRSKVTWLWLHGNAGNISHRLENIKLLHDELGVNIFIFDYRGYGKSEGTPDEAGTYRDAAAALAYLKGRPDVDPESIVYFGRSLGCAVAAELARSDPPRALILESPFTSVPDMARLAFPLLPLGFLVLTKYDALAKVPQVQAPVMVLHGDRDETVPIEHGRRIFEAAAEPKRFYTIVGADHNNTYARGGKPYFAALASFLAEFAGLE